MPVPPKCSKEEAHELLVAIEKGVDDAAKQVQEMVNRRIVERFFLEIEMYEGVRKLQTGIGGPKSI